MLDALKRFKKSYNHFLLFSHNHTVLSLEWNLQRTLVVYFLIFGMFGWGIKFSTFGNTVSLLNNLLILGIPLFLFYLRNRLSQYFNFFLRISLRDAISILTISLVLSALNFDWVSRSLTGDELFYALKSHAHSYRLLISLDPYLPPFIRTFEGAKMIQFISLGALALVVLLIYVNKPKKFSLASFGLIFFLLIISRVILFFWGVTSQPNSPTPSIILYGFTSILGISDESFRISTAVFSAIFIFLSGRLLRGKKVFGIHGEATLVFCLIILYSSFRIILSPEISFMAITVMGFILARWWENSAKLDSSLILSLGFLISFRVPSAILVTILLLLSFFVTRKSGNYLPREAWSPLILCVPIITTFTLSRYSSGTFTQDSSSIIRRFEDFLELLNTSGTFLLLLLSLVTLFIFVAKAPELKVLTTFVALYIGLFAIVFLIGSSLPMQSKYSYELVVPLAALSLFSTLKGLGEQDRLGVVSRLVRLLLVATILSVSVYHHQVLPKTYRAAEILIGGQDTEFLTRYHFIVPSDYGNALRVSATHSYGSCIFADRVYGAFPEVLASLSLEEVARAEIAYGLFTDSPNHSVGGAISYKLLSATKTKCIIVSKLTQRDLFLSVALQDGWNVAWQSLDSKYGVRTIILTRL